MFWLLPLMMASSTKRNNCSHNKIVESISKKPYFKRAEDKDVLEGYVILYRKYSCMMCGHTREKKFSEQRDETLDVSREDVLRYNYILKLYEVV